MSHAEKISVTITSEMLQTVRECVDSGEYASTSEIMRDALRLWTRQRDEDAERLAAIRSRIGRSIDDPRPDVPLDEAFDRIEQRHGRASGQ